MYSSALDRLLDVEDATATLRTMVREKVGGQRGFSDPTSKDAAAEAEAEAVALENLVATYSPGIKARYVNSFF